MTDIKHNIGNGYILKGDCLDTLKTLPDNSIDSVVTDPPYEIGFMGKAWDGSGIAYNTELWTECLRVLKPGGHLLSFGATRSYHRMAVAIEDAGFEIRDSLHWSYGSGFPKSLNVGKAIDKQKPLTDNPTENEKQFTEWILSTGVSREQIKKVSGSDRYYTGIPEITNTATASHPKLGRRSTIPTPTVWEKLRPLFAEVPDTADNLVSNPDKYKPGPNWFKREKIGTDTKARSEGGDIALPTQGAETVYKTWDITAPATEAAKQWEGWGTALKPSHEIITVARKPLIGTVAANVQEWGTGALNIDGSRVGTEQITINGQGNDNLFHGKFSGNVDNPERTGRFPANTLLTHNWDCEQTGSSTDAWSATGIQSAPLTALKGGEDGSLNVSVSSGGATTPIYTCTPGCPVAALDKQSGNCKVGAVRPYTSKHDPAATSTSFQNGDNPHRDYTSTASEGGASRFFQQLNWSEQDKIIYIPKPSKKERNAGLDGLPEKTAGEVTNRKEGSAGLKSPRAGTGRTSGNTNTHPTVKPVRLMEYLVKLVTPPSGTVLDPFLGSGTTAVAAENLGFKWVGCELTDEYYLIIEGRVAHAVEQAKSSASKNFLI